MTYDDSTPANPYVALPELGFAIVSGSRRNVKSLGNGVCVQIASSSVERH
jgi:hypothetical protein